MVAGLTTDRIPSPDLPAMTRAVSCSNGWKNPGPSRKLRAHSSPTGVYTSAPRSREASVMNV